MVYAYSVVKKIEDSLPIELKKDMTILFQGDSITDCDRGYSGYGEMGYGYANIVTIKLYKEYPELNLSFLNRGISGERVEDLLARWEGDCIQLKPDVVSVLVGVNNTWPRYFSSNITDEEAFYNDYCSIMQKTKDTLDPQLILCEPFILNVSEDIKAWREDLDPKIEIVRKLAKKFSAILVPFDTMFAEASKEVDPAHWAEDGVHPTQAGHELMAKEWLRCVVGIDL